MAVHEPGHAAPLSSTPGSFVANFFIVLAGDVVGLLLIAAAFSRHSLGATTELLFWSGLAIVLLPSFFVLIRPWAKTWQTVVLLAQLAIGLYLIKILRLPHAVGFDDEFGHFRQLKATMSSGNPFTYNPILPIIGHYPGLPIVTSTVAWVSRLPAFTAAMIVIGAARIASLISIFFIAKAFSRERTAPAIACMVFIGGPTYLYFDAQYGYESLGFPLALAAIAVALSIYQAGTPRKIQWLWAAFVLLAAGSTVTHHLSSGFMVATLGFMALFAGVQKIGNWRRLVWATGIAAVFVLVWTLIESPGSLTYVGNQSVKPFSNFLSGGGSVRAPFSTTFLAAPVWERIFSIRGVDRLQGMAQWGGPDLGGGGWSDLSRDLDRPPRPWHQRGREPCLWIHNGVGGAAAGDLLAETLRVEDSGSGALCSRRCPDRHVWLHGRNLLLPALPDPLLCGRTWSGRLV